MQSYVPVEKQKGEIPEEIFNAATLALEALALLRPGMPEYEQCKEAICVAGMLYLGKKKLPLAREMYRLGMYGNGKGLSNLARTLMIEAMKNSKDLNKEIFERTKPGNDFFTDRFDFGFKRKIDEDLYYSVQNVNMWISGIYLGNNFWNITVRMTDKYDFTEFRGGLEFANIANNLGEAMQRNGMITPFDTEIEYSYIWERTKVE